MVGWWGDFRNQLGVIKINLERHCFLFFAFNHQELHLCIYTFEKKVFDGAHAYCYYFMLFCSLLSIIERASRVFRITCKPSYCPLEANESSIISAFLASYLNERLSRDQSPQGLLWTWEQESAVGLINPENVNEGKNQKAHRFGRKIKIEVPKAL